MLVLEKDAIAQDAPISFILRTGEIHDWALTTLLDGAQVQPQIYQELGLTDAASAATNGSDNLAEWRDGLQNLATELTTGSASSGSSLGDLSTALLLGELEGHFDDERQILTAATAGANGLVGAHKSGRVDSVEPIHLMTGSGAAFPTRLPVLKIARHVPHSGCRMRWRAPPLIAGHRSGASIGIGTRGGEGPCAGHCCLLLKLFICPRPLATRDRGIGSVDRVRPVDGNWIGGYASRQDGRESRERRGQGCAYNYMKSSRWVKILTQLRRELRELWFEDARARRDS